MILYYKATNFVLLIKGRKSTYNRYKFDIFMEKTALTEHLKTLRKRQGYSQSQMAEQLHMALKSYQNIENGITKIDLDRLKNILDIFNIEWMDFFIGDSPAHISVEYYKQIIQEKERYIEKLERDVIFYQKILENRI